MKNGVESKFPRVFFIPSTIFMIKKKTSLKVQRDFTTNSEYTYVPGVRIYTYIYRCKTE